MPQKREYRLVVNLSGIGRITILQTDDYQKFHTTQEALDYTAMLDTNKVLGKSWEFNAGDGWKWYIQAGII